MPIVLYERADKIYVFLELSGEPVGEIDNGSRLVVQIHAAAIEATNTPERRVGRAFSTIVCLTSDRRAILICMFKRLREKGDDPEFFRER